MPQYIIERDVPGASNLSGLELREISSNSCVVIRELGEGIKWIHSYVAGDKIYCVYADNEDIIRRSSEMVGLPFTKITEISTVISPETADL
jgi:hypothetical protein